MNLTIEIERNIPLPVARYSKKDPRAVFKKMKVGDSFAVEYADQRDINRIVSRFWYYAKQYEWQITSRRIEDGQTKIVRIWRIK